MAPITSSINIGLERTSAPERNVIPSNKVRGDMAISLDYPLSPPEEECLVNSFLLKKAISAAMPIDFFACLVLFPLCTPEISNSSFFLK